MTYGQQMTARTRYDFAAVAAITAANRRAERKKLARLRILKRVLHFIGFLSYWAVALSVTYLVLLAIMVLFVCLA